GSHRPGVNEFDEFSVLVRAHGVVLLLLGYVVACIAALLPITWTEWQVPRSAWPIRFLPIWLLSPVLFTPAVSILRPLFLGRYFVFCLPALVLLAGAGLARLNRTWLLILPLGVLI